MRRRPILMYHAVGTGPDPLSIQVSAARLRQQLETLRRLGYAGVSMRELLRQAGSRRRLVGLTFDDGYADFSSAALPVLAEFGFTATVFVVAGHIGGSNDWDSPPRRSLMNAAEVKAVAAAGHEVGSHGMRHLRSDHLSAAELHFELSESRRVLEGVLDAPVPGFCYPYGALDGAAVAAVRQHYEYGCGVGIAAEVDRWSIPRFFVGQADTPVRLTAKLALRPVREWRQSRAL